jgi:hypothetical protein
LPPGGVVPVAWSHGGKPGGSGMSRQGAHCAQSSHTVARTRADPGSEEDGTALVCVESGLTADEAEAIVEGRAPWPE